ncbi:MAG: hypothetical protein AAFW64_09750, partial [Pseudomonadota bacterium]
MHTAPDLPLLGLPADSEVAFCYQPDAEARAALVHAFDLQSLKKIRLEGRMIPEGQSDWRLEAKLGADQVQCATAGPFSVSLIRIGSFSRGLWPTWWQCKGA